MAIDNPLQEQSAPEPTAGPESERRGNTTVTWVEMGSVSMETKGTVTGLEIGFTPRS